MFVSMVLGVKCVEVTIVLSLPQSFALNLGTHLLVRQLLILTVY